MTSLPQISAPVSKTTLPCSGIEVEFRPFLVKEEKILIIAAESEDEKAIDAAVLQVVTNCTFGKIDFEKVPAVDLQWMILQLRKHAKGNNIELFFKCEATDEEGKKCGHTNEIVKKIDDVKYYGPTSGSKRIELTDQIGIKMKVPTMKDAKDIRMNDSVEGMFDTIISAMEMIYNGDEVWQIENVPRKELEAFIEELPPTQFNRVQAFIDNLPRLVLEVDFECKKCKHTEKIELTGLDSFFV